MVRPYAAYVRVRPWIKHAFDVQVGQIPPSFGAYGRRGYQGGDNPFIGYPLAYQYLTSLRPDAAPATVADLLVMRARGWQTTYPIGSTTPAPGVPLISAFRWDTGFQAHWEGRVVDVTGSVTVGTLADPRFEDNNSGKQVSSRVAYRPATGLILGGSAARGEFFDRTVTTALSNSGGSHAQSALGADVEYSRGYWLVRSELVWSRWNVPFASPAESDNVDALGAWVEARYRVTPRIVVSGRADRLGFSRLVVSPSLAPTWDANVCARRGRRRLLHPAQPRRAASPCSTTSGTAVESASGRMFRRRSLTGSDGSPDSLRSLGRERAGPVGGRRRHAARRRTAIGPTAPFAAVWSCGRLRPTSRRARSVGDVSMPQAARSDRSPTQRRLSRIGAAGAFDHRDEPRAKLDQRNEAFVPHVLAIVAGTTVDFPNNDTTYHNVFSLSTTQLVRSRPLRRRPLEVRAIRSPRHRPRVLRHPLAHERLHPGLRAPLFRRDRRRRPVSARQRAAWHLHRDGVERVGAAQSRAASSVPEAGGDVEAELRARPPMTASSTAMSLFSSLTNRIFFGSALLAVASIAIAIYNVNVAVTRRPNRSCGAASTRRARSSTSTAAMLFEHFTREARLIADLPRLKAAVDTNDPTTVQPIADGVSAAARAPTCCSSPAGRARRSRRSRRPALSTGSYASLPGVSRRTIGTRSRARFWPHAGGILRSSPCRSGSIRSNPRSSAR